MAGGATVGAGGLVLTSAQVAIIIIALAAMAAIHALLTFTRIGKAMRATAANPMLARACGIATGRIIDAVWVITGALCGLAGTVAAMDSGSFGVGNGSEYLIVVLAAVVLGGAGQPYGAMLGAVLIGETTELSAAVLSPEYKQAVAFAILVLVMILRPQGLLVRRRLRSDYQAIALLGSSVIANTMITNVRPFLNGAAGLSLVPPPLGDLVNANSAGYQWLYVGLTALGCGVVLAAATRIVESPFGRTLRAMREREPAAAALGKNLVMLKMVMFIAGGVIAGLSGAVLVGFIGVWAPATWLYPETIVIFAALIVGGRGNNLGALLGALLVPVGFEEVTRFLPQVGPPGLIPAMQWVAIGLLIIGFLWFRPRGTLPERRRVFADPFPGGAVRAQGPVGRGSEETVSADRARPLLAAERVERRFEGLR